ncbi:MAG: hypothetical protein KF712_20685 [Akkermansiaceae bacterium]|nr:hypothetical protein [Akkermansiaceae bacterium]
MKIPLFLSLAVLSMAATAQDAPESFPAPRSLGDVTGRGKNIQRTMRLLAESTPERRNTVRILFYGQSITEQGWWKIVADDLRKRFPHADLVIENRALGGFSSQLLVRTAESDLYPFQPDLVIFHVYGAHDKYEDIIRRIRERTCAEILQQNDHITKPEALAEETDPAKATIQAGDWDAFMNHNFLPSVSRKYGTEFCDQRALWKQYLRDHALQPQALLKDNVHLNAHGEHVMAEFVKSYLRYDPALGSSPAEDWVKTLAAGKDFRFSDGKLKLGFTGNRVDVICKAGETAPAAILIDGRKPSAHPELYGATRAQPKPGWKWPPVAPITLGGTPEVEDWTMEVTTDAGGPKVHSFTLTGSVTGADGEGRSDQPFVSKSGRISIAPDAWGVEFALGTLAGLKPLPPTFTVTWKTAAHFTDSFISPGIKDPAVETTVTLAQGLENGTHTLEISGGEATISGLRIYHPPLGGK